MRLPSLLVGLGLLTLAWIGPFAPRVLAAELPALAADDRWAKEMRAFEAADRASPPPDRPIVFTGSSSIRMWADLATDYPNLRVLNRGFGGSTLKDLLRHFERTILQYNPRQVVIYSGTNDINAGRPVDAVVGDLKTLVDRIHAELPQTRILFVALALNPARWDKRDLMIEANGGIAACLAKDPRDSMINVNAVMLESDGQPKADIFIADRLHMNRKGYELWAPLIRPYLLPL